MAAEVANENGKATTNDSKRPAVTIKSFVPYVCVEAPRAQEALDWYKDVFGFEETAKWHAEKRKAGHDAPLIIHSTIKLGNLELYLSDHRAWDEGESELTPGTQLPGTNFYFHMEVSDVDLVVAYAVEKGAKITTPVEDKFWGARFGKITDPFGVQWGISKQSTEEGTGEDKAAEKAADPPGQEAAA